MKKYILILAVLSLLLVAACVKQAESPKEGVSSTVPAPGNEDVEETVVVDDSETGSDEAVTLPVEEGSLVHDIPKEETKTEDLVEEETKLDDLMEIDMTAKRFQFDPSTITVKQGQKVKLNIRSLDVTHGFSLPDYKIIERLDPGKTATVEFTADKKGTFTYFCSVYCGSGHGAMRGKLVVE